MWLWRTRRCHQSGRRLPLGRVGPGRGLASRCAHINEFRLEAEKHGRGNLAGELSPNPPGVIRLMRRNELSVHVYNLNGARSNR
jgi:hypothetical protein